MLKEVQDFFKPRAGMVFVDGTIGEGGHSVQIVRRIIPGGLLIGIDRDLENLERARERLNPFLARIRLFHGSYSGVSDFIQESGKKKADAILLDLGFSTRHIADPARGFSFMKNEPVDMRYDRSTGIPAYEWISNASEEEIGYVLIKYGDENRGYSIARAIKNALKDNNAPLTGIRLASIIASAKRKYSRVNPATKTFQAIRIHINDELKEVAKGVHTCLESLSEGGKLGVITYHSAEDRIVKTLLKNYERRCSCPPGLPVCSCNESEKRPLVKVWNKSGIAPEAEEISLNPSARSARLRGCRVMKAA